MRRKITDELIDKLKTHILDIISDLQNITHNVDNYDNTNIKRGRALG